MRAGVRWEEGGIGRTAGERPVKARLSVTGRAGQLPGSHRRRAACKGTSLSRRLCVGRAGHAAGGGGRAGQARVVCAARRQGLTYVRAHLPRGARKVRVGPTCDRRRVRPRGGAAHAVPKVGSPATGSRRSRAEAFFGHPGSDMACGAARLVVAAKHDAGAAQRCCSRCCVRRTRDRRWRKGSLST